MRVRTMGTGRAAAAAVLFLVGGTAWAQKPTAAEQRQQATERLTELEARLERVPPADVSPHRLTLDLAKRYAELSRKLLRQNNVRASRAMADLAERCLTPFETPEESQ